MKQPFMLFPNVESRVWAGIFTFTGMIILLTWVIINEEGRMEEFTQRFEGRSVETGAQLFESNCSECHGTQGYGITGVAPALNNPVLFGYNFFVEYDEPLDALKAELEALEGSDPERAAELDAEIGKLEAERLALEEELLYDYAEEYVALDEQLTALENRIEEEYGISPPLFGVETQTLIDQRDALQNEILPLQAQINTALNAGEDVDPEDQARLDALMEEFLPLDEEANAADSLRTEQTTLAAKVGRFRALDDANVNIGMFRNDIAEKESELATLPPVPETGDDPVADERGVLLDEIATLKSSLSDAVQDRDKARDALIKAGDIVPYDTGADPRMVSLKWSGSLHDLVLTTIISGRPVSSNYWPRPMAAWSQTAGGPMRGDQIENLVSYILNWDREFTVDDTRSIQQYAVLPINPDATVAAPVGTNVEAIIEELATIETDGPPDDAEEGVVYFDSVAGQQAFNGDLGCAGCHVTGAGTTAPDIQGVALRAQEQSDLDPDTYPTARHYLVHSIVLPGDFIVEGFADAMPKNFGEDRIDLPTISNIIAYLESLDN
jgi:mono/diheme cytochrome c family protein